MVYPRYRPLFSQLCSVSVKHSISRASRDPLPLRILLSQNGRVSSSKSRNDEDEKPRRNKPPEQPYPRQKAPSQLATASWKGVGQVIFLNSEMSGKILLASLAVGDPLLAGMATVGSFASTSTARWIAQLDAKTTNAGLYSYNGCLVGCAASVFIWPACSGNILSLLSFTMVGSAASTYTAAALSRTTSPMPQWTYAFNIVTLSALLNVKPLLVDPAAPAVLAVDPSMASTVLESSTVVATTVATTSLFTLSLSPLTGLSQIFVIDSALTGSGVLAAIATYSPALAGHALAGSVTGSLVGGLFLGASGTDLASGLYGFNAALTSMGVGVFFCRTPASYGLAVAGAAATTIVMGALQPVFATFGSPCLTLPFCLTMSACWALGSRPVPSSSATPSSDENGTTDILIPGLILAPNPHSPEKNVAS